MTIRSHLRKWLRWRKEQRLKREAQIYERKRAAIIRSIANRRQKHRAWKPMLGELREATTQALAREVGREGV